VGVLSGGTGAAHDGVAMDADEAAGGPDATAVLEMFEHREGCSLGEMAAIQRCALAFREAGAAGVARELSVWLGFTVVAADREVAGIAPAVEGPVGVLAAEAGEVIPGAQGLAVMGQDAIRRENRRPSPILRPVPHQGSTCLGHDPLPGGEPG